MNNSTTAKYFFAKSPLVRVLVLICIIVFILGGIYLFKYNTKPTPYIDAITPPVGNPGDVVVISGRNFGKERDMNYVEFGGAKLTASSYLMWTDNTIKVVIPANVQDGLVVVSAGKLKSKPAFFANASEIPVEIKEVQQITKPVIWYLSTEKGELQNDLQKIHTGSRIIITGNNFGDSRGQAKVYFNANYGSTDLSSQTEDMIPVWEDDFGYEYWTNSEIRVRIPDGAVSGYVVVETSAGKSEPVEIKLNTKIGTKEFGDRKMFLVNYSVDLADIETKDSATITLRCPVPAISANQSKYELTEVKPEPVLEYFQKTMIHQLALEKNSANRIYFRQSFVLPVYSITTNVNADAVQNKNPDISDVLYAVATREDELIPSGNEEVIELARKIVKTEKNPYKQAKLVYNYMIENYKIQNEFRNNDANPLDLLKQKKGDAYDFSILFTSLLRALDIPAFADCGLLVSPDLTTRNHMWSEFYISGIGWIPVDVALGAGLEYNKWDEDINSVEYYFGNIDSHHIKFSRGINSLKPFSQDNKIVQRPRAFAFQTIWEEASNSTVKYSSFWSDPVVKGIY
ncbi:MAG: IPT/TIG domain-containing protein [Treponema sp.]|nr:IPT/TIG domain-containing protein [Treponema sp.]